MKKHVALLASAIALAVSGVATAGITVGPGKGNPQTNSSGKCPGGQNKDTSPGGVKKCPGGSARRRWRDRRPAGPPRPRGGNQGSSAAARARTVDDLDSLP